MLIVWGFNKSLVTHDRIYIGVLARGVMVMVFVFGVIFN
jgi:hypothetical protein